MRHLFAVLVSSFLLWVVTVSPVAAQTASGEENSVSAFRLSPPSLDLSKIALARFRAVDTAVRPGGAMGQNAAKSASPLPSAPRLLLCSQTESGPLAPVAETRTVVRISRANVVRAGGAETILQPKTAIGSVVVGKAIAAAPKRKAAAPTPIAARTAGVLRAKDEVTRKATVVVDAAAPKEAIRLDTKTEEALLNASQSVLMTPARAIYKPEPDIPLSLLSTDCPDKVILKVAVEADGNHSERFVTGTGSREMDAAILDYLRRWRWEPATRDGKRLRTENKVTLKITGEQAAANNRPL